jgi:hypothetical protein
MADALKDTFDKEAFEKALGTLAVALIDERQRQAAEMRAGYVREINWCHCEVLLKEGPESLREIYRKHIIECPIAGALRLAIRELGEHAFENVRTTDGMLSILEAAAARHPEREDLIISAVDHAWDGIGCAKDGQIWWA